MAAIPALAGLLGLAAPLFVIVCACALAFTVTIKATLAPTSASASWTTISLTTFLGVGYYGLLALLSLLLADGSSLVILERLPSNAGLAIEVPWLLITGWMLYDNLDTNL